MRSSAKKSFVALAIVSSLVIGAFLLISKANSQAYDKGEIVKLYSGNNLVATWKAVSHGQTDGNTYVFKVGTNTSPVEVRISGTYSVERIP